nr:Inner membrane protein YqjA [Candidatus Pantoea persica]
MDILHALLQALWQQDYERLSDPTLVWAIYGVLFIILFLENDLLPAAFLPGDSLLILVGVLIAKGTMSFPLTILVLNTGASLSAAGAAIFRDAGSAIRRRCKNGCRTGPRSITPAHTACFTGMDFRRY